MTYPNKENIDLIRGARIQLMPDMIEFFMEYPSLNNCLSGKTSSSILKNQDPTLPRGNNQAPTVVLKCFSEPSPKSMDQIAELVQLIRCVKELGVTDPSVVLN